MTYFRRNIRPGGALLCALIALIGGSLVSAQARRPRALANRPPQNGSAQFGDVTLSHFENAVIQLGKMAKATGPDTTVDAEAPKGNGKGRLQARQITVYMVPDANNRVDRIEAVGNVRFQGTRAASEAGTQMVRATGSRGIYYRQRQFLEIEGPIDFYGEQPTADGKGKQTVRGTAARATYDEEKRIVVLSGNVSAVVVTPETPPQGSTLVSEGVTVNMSVQPWEILLESPSKTGKVTIPIKETEKQKPPEKK